MNRLRSKFEICPLIQMFTILLSMTYSFSITIGKNIHMGQLCFYEQRMSCATAGPDMDGEEQHDVGLRDV